MQALIALLEGLGETALVGKIAGMTMPKAFQIMLAEKGVG